MRIGKCWGFDEGRSTDFQDCFAHFFLEMELVRFGWHQALFQKNFFYLKSLESIILISKGESLKIS